MSKRVLTLDPLTGKKRLETVIDDAVKAAGRDDMAYTAKAVDDKVTAINSAMDQAIVNLKSNTSYQNAVLGVYKTKTDFTPVDNGRYVVGTQFLIYHAAIAQVGTIGEEGYVAPQTESWELVSTASVGTAVYDLLTKREYRYEPSRVTAQFKGVNDTAWFDTNATDDLLVQTTKDQTIAGIKTFTSEAIFEQGVSVGGNLQVDGDLIVNGTTTTVDTVNMVIKDNLILLNNGELGEGVTNGAAGIEVDRGLLTIDQSPLAKAQLYFDESDDLWKAGLQGSLLTIARIDDTQITSTTETYSIDKINNLISNTQEYAENSTLFSFVAAEDIAIGDIVYVTLEGKVAKASCDNLATMNLLAGIATETVVAEETVRVAKFGRVSKSSGLVPGKSYFLDLDGKIAQTVPSESGQYICMIGVATDATTLLLQIGEAIELA